MVTQPLSPLTPSAATLAVSCPRCPASTGPATWVHMRRVEVDRMGDVVEVAPDGVGFLDRPSSEMDMGSAVRIEFWCESGHQFAWDLRFGRGATSFEVDAGMTEFDPQDYMDELPRL
ncbi:MAG: hypothetical protein IT303_10420 [Dehalococcoidia bacterium]|nr:hypothetical protein [Dehalococcoidia bacterium]